MSPEDVAAIDRLRERFFVVDIRWFRDFNGDCVRVEVGHRYPADIGIGKTVAEAEVDLIARMRGEK